MEPISIGKVARRTGFGIETIRYYERLGLIPKSARKPSGYRQFSEEAIAHLRFVRRAKELGFTLEEIKDLLSLKLSPNQSSRGVKRLAVEKLAEIEGKIKTLQRMRRVLRKLTIACDGRGSTSHCPILQALES
jgi:MerR family copper efflux transcriptional regulator